MPASRIAFALGDAFTAIMATLKNAERSDIRIDIVLDTATYDSVVGELEYHFGAKLPAGAVLPGDLRGQASVKFSNMRIVRRPPGA